MFQIIPTLINSYLVSLSKRCKNSVDLFEMFFLAIYNEEILDGGTGSESMTKKFEEIRIPSVRYPINYDSMKLQTIPDITQKCNNQRVQVKNKFLIFFLYYYLECNSDWTISCVRSNYCGK